jgi:hypothetical protein
VTTDPFEAFWDEVQKRPQRNPVDPEARKELLKDIAKEAFRLGYDRGFAAAESWYHEDICQ